MYGRVVTASDFEVADLHLFTIDAQRVIRVAVSIAGFPQAVFIALTGDSRSGIRIGDVLEYGDNGVKAYRVRE